MHTGKTNHGQKLCGRSMRHEQVELCSVGAMAACLAMRFFLTSEFENFDLNDFLDNKKWFDVKLLVDANRADHDHSKAMANDTHAKAVKSVLGKLGLHSNHWLHLGRTIGPKCLEMLDVEQDDIRQLGNWNPSTQESACSTKLPMKVIRAANGFMTANGMHCNARTVVEGEAFDRLKKKTPFAWAHDAIAFFDKRFLEGAEKETHCMACEFIKFMVKLNTVFLQDAAAMLVKFPQRSTCSMHQMPVFQDPDWPVSIFVFVLIILCFVHSTDTFVSAATGLLGAHENVARHLGGDKPSGL
jgi:hypothetical protein